MSRNPRATIGQASIEWVAIVALVAGLLALGAALSHGLYVGRSITRQMARALCVVRAGDCWHDREPCVVDSKDEHKGLTVHVFFVRLGGGYRAIVEQRSDGTVAVTRALDGSLGAEVTGGAMAKLRLGGANAEVGEEVDAAISEQMGVGMTWIVPSMKAADDLVDDLHHLRIPSPDAYQLEGGLHGEAGASAVAEAFGTSVEAAKAGIEGDVHGGVRVDRVTGHETMFVQGSVGASASAAGGVVGWSGTAASDVYALDLDDAGRPVDLRITSTGAYAGGRGLPAVVRPAASMLGAGTGVLQVTTHLDLTERDNAAAAMAVVASMLRRAVPEGSLVQALRRRVDESGTVEARVLSASSASTGLAGEVGGDGVRVGIEASSDTKSLHLVAAASRGLDGQWLPRDDCVPTGDAAAA